MSHSPRSQPICTRYEYECFQRDKKGSQKHPYYESGIIEIGKLNIFLIALIGMIVIVLISRVLKEEGSATVYSQSVQVEPEPAPVAMVPQSQALPEATVAQVTPPKTESKVIGKKPKKTEVPAPLMASETALPVQMDRAAQPVQAEAVPALQNDSSRNIIVFNIWSVSELRLRGAYTKLMNDSSIPQAQADATKKDYLNFVNRRTRKCGELDNRFASNINTVEKLSFHERDVGILKCHTSENIAELDRLMLSHGFNS